MPGTYDSNGDGEDAEWRVAGGHRPLIAADGAQREARDSARKRMTAGWPGSTVLRRQDPRSARRLAAFSCSALQPIEILLFLMPRV